MLEKHRLTYLDHLGIENYMPRRILPNALPSQLLSDEALMEPAAFSTADTPFEVHPTHDPASLDKPPSETIEKTPPIDVMAELLGKKPVDTQQASSSQNTPQQQDVSQDASSAPSAVTAAADTSAHSEKREAEVNHELAPKNTASTETIRFSLSVWRINHDIMVIDTRQPATALPTDRLLQNILRSIGCHLAQLPPSDILRWPLFKDDSLSHPEDEARAMVQAYVSAQVSKAPIKTLLLLGHDAVRFTLDVGDDSQHFYHEHKGGALLQEQWQSTALIAPSLIDMLQEPLQKRITWQALQTLVQATL